MAPSCDSRPSCDIAHPRRAARHPSLTADPAAVASAVEPQPVQSSTPSHSPCCPSRQSAAALRRQQPRRVDRCSRIAPPQRSVSGIRELTLAIRRQGRATKREPRGIVWSPSSPRAGRCRSTSDSCVCVDKLQHASPDLAKRTSGLASALSRRCDRPIGQARTRRTIAAAPFPRRRRRSQWWPSTRLQRQTVLPTRPCRRSTSVASTSSSASEIGARAQRSPPRAPHSGPGPYLLLVAAVDTHASRAASRDEADRWPDREEDHMERS